MDDTDKTIHNLKEEKELVDRTWSPHVAEAFQAARKEINVIAGILDKFGIHLDAKQQDRMFDTMLKSHLDPKETKLLQDFNSWKVDRSISTEDKSAILQFDEQAKKQFFEKVDSSPPPRPKSGRSI